SFHVKHPRVATPWRRVYDSGMKEKERTVQTAVRMPESWIPRLDAIAAKLGDTGLDVSQAAVIRVALARGIAALEEAHGLARPNATAEAPEKGAKPARKPARKAR